VHVAFGDELTADYEDPEAVAAELDRQIIDNYVLHPSNCFAYQAIHGKTPPVNVGKNDIPFSEQRFRQAERQFVERLRAMDPRYRPYAREMYANPVVSKLDLTPNAAHLEQKLA